MTNTSETSKTDKTPATDILRTVITQGGGAIAIILALVLTIKEFAMNTYAEDKVAVCDRFKAIEAEQKLMDGRLKLLEIDVRVMRAEQESIKAILSEIKADLKEIKTFIQQLHK